MAGSSFASWLTSPTEQLGMSEAPLWQSPGAWAKQGLDGTCRRFPGMQFMRALNHQEMKRKLCKATQWLHFRLI